MISNQLAEPITPHRQAVPNGNPRLTKVQGDESG